jgi:hypothetical protein
MLRQNSRALRVILVTGMASGLMTLSDVGRTQSLPGSAGSSAPAVSPQVDYHPSLGDLMTMAVQPRHTKLGLAGQEQNWAYAQYEVSELRNALARVARTIPIYRTADMAALINALTAEPLAAVEQAIRAGDSRQFKTAYARLTTACNACHLSQDHASIVIRVPGANPYADQDFRKLAR